MFTLSTNTINHFSVAAPHQENFCDLGILYKIYALISLIDDAAPLRITTDPTGSKYAVPGKQCTMTIQVSGAESVSCQQHCNPMKDDGCGEQCSNVTTPSIPKELKSNIRNHNSDTSASIYDGSQTSNPVPAKLEVGLIF